ACQLIELRRRLFQRIRQLTQLGGVVASKFAEWHDEPVRGREKFLAEMVVGDGRTGQYGHKSEIRNPKSETAWASGFGFRISDFGFRISSLGFPLTFPAPTR